MSLAPGDRLGAYEVLATLGAGGMGEIYQARDTRLDRIVAIKVLLTHLSAVPQFRERFEREARAVAALGHPHICALFDIGVQDGSAYLVMEYVEGGSLAQRMRRGAAPLDSALRLLRQTADALDKAHRQGIVHRDIKPSNILIDADGHAKLADFGVAKQFSVELAGGPQITADGMAVGTPSYMSPEQARGEPVGPPSDIFSLGCILFELVAMRPPFERTTTIETLHAVVNEPPPRLTATGLPAGLTSLVEATLDKDPAKRPTARVVSDHLEAIVAPGRAGGETQTMLPSSLAQQPRRRKGWITAVLIAALVALFVPGGALDIWRTWSSAAPLDFRAQETVMVGAIENLTGDRSLENVLGTALRISLEQSRYVNVLSPQRVHDTLVRMRKPDDEPLTEGVAREICQREGVKALVGGSVEQAGGLYVLTARIIEPATGKAVRTLTERVAAPREILAAADALGLALRRALGESLGSIQGSSVKLAETTTASLDALMLYTQAADLLGRGRIVDARTLLHRAIQIDPEFARAYASLAITYRGPTGIVSNPTEAQRYFESAFKWVDKLGERERLEIEALYSGSQGNHEEAARLYRSLIERHPGVAEYHVSLGTAYRLLGRPANAISELQAALKLNARSAPAWLGLGAAHADLKQWKEEVASFEQAFGVEPELETDDIQNHQYGWGLLRLGNEARARAAFEKMVAQGGTKTARGRRSLGILALSHGRIDEARLELLESARINDVAGNTVSAARDHYYLAEAFTLVDRRDAASAEIRRGLELIEKDGFAQAWLGLRLTGLLARIGQPVEASRLLEILRTKLGDDSMMRSELLRAEGELLLARRSNDQGIEKLRQARSALPWYQTKAALASGAGRVGLVAEATTLHEQLIADGPEPWEGHVDWAVAHERLGRLYEQAGEKGKARETYGKLLELWKSADEDLEPLRRAREALRRLSSG